MLSGSRSFIYRQFVKVDTKFKGVKVQPINIVTDCTEAITSFAVMCPTIDTHTISVNNKTNTAKCLIIRDKSSVAELKFQLKSLASVVCKTFKNF